MIRLWKHAINRWESSRWRIKIFVSLPGRKWIPCWQDMLHIHFFPFLVWWVFVTADINIQTLWSLWQRDIAKIGNAYSIAKSIFCYEIQMTKIKRRLHILKESIWWTIGLIPICFCRNYLIEFKLYVDKHTPRGDSFWLLHRLFGGDGWLL